MNSIHRRSEYAIALDKICFASEERVEVVKFKPYQDDLQQRFTPLGVVKIEDDLLGEIIEADSALFGYIVEGENGLFSNKQYHGALLA